jgi:hypothetical protein
MVLEAAAASGAAAAETASVPTASVAAGDVLRVLPGERMPVRAGSTDPLLQHGGATAFPAVLPTASMALCRHKVAGRLSRCSAGPNSCMQPSAIQNT